MTLFLRLLGTLLLLLAGMGGGFAAAARAENSRRQLHSFARLLTYLAELLDAQALTGPELLRRAAQDPAFAVFCPAPGESLSALTPPACMPDALPHGPAAMAAAGGLSRRTGRHFAVVRSGPYGHRPCF